MTSLVINRPSQQPGSQSAKIIGISNGTQTEPQSEIVRFHAFDINTGNLRPPTERELNTGFINQDLQKIGGLRNRTLREDAVLDPLVQIAVERMIGQSEKNIEQIITTVFAGTTWSPRTQFSADGALNATIKTIMMKHSRRTFAFEDASVDYRTLAADVEAANNIIRFRKKLEKELQYCDSEGSPVPTGDNFQKARLTDIILGSKEAEAAKAKAEVELWQHQFIEAAEKRNRLLLDSGARKWSVCNIELDSASLGLSPSVRVQLDKELDVRKPYYFKYDFFKDNPAASETIKKQEVSRLADDLEAQLKALNAFGNLTKADLEAAFRVADVPFAVQLSPFNKVKVSGDGRFSGDFVAARSVRELSNLVAAYQTATGNPNASLFFDGENQQLSKSTPPQVSGKLAKMERYAQLAVEQFKQLYLSVNGIEAGMTYLRPDRDTVMHSSEVNELQRAMVTRLFPRTFTLDEPWLQKVGLEVDTTIGADIVSGKTRGPRSKMPTITQVQSLRTKIMEERALAREKEPLQKLLVEYYSRGATGSSQGRTKQFGEMVSILKVELSDGTHLNVKNGPQNVDGDTVLKTEDVVKIQRTWEAIQSLEKKLSKAQGDYIEGRSTGNRRETSRGLASIEMKLEAARQEMVQLLDAHFDVQPDRLRKGIRVAVTGQIASDVADAYAVLFESQAAGVAAGVVGNACEDVDRASRAVIEKAGYGEYFVHRTGHGIGMEAHEDPYMVSGNKLPIAAGHAFSVEPGIYIPGKWGMRLEDIVVATVNGPDSMNAANHNLIVVEA
jgi:hypothetical protein